MIKDSQQYDGLLPSRNVFPALCHLKHIRNEWEMRNKFEVRF